MELIVGLFRFQGLFCIGRLKRASQKKVEKEKKEVLAHQATEDLQVSC